MEVTKAVSTPARALEMLPCSEPVMMNIVRADNNTSIQVLGVPLWFNHRFACSSHLFPSQKLFDLHTSNWIYWSRGRGSPSTSSDLRQSTSSFLQRVSTIGACQLADWRHHEDGLLFQLRAREGPLGIQNVRYLPSLLRCRFRSSILRVWKRARRQRRQACCGEGKAITLTTIILFCFLHNMSACLLI